MDLDLSVLDVPSVSSGSNGVQALRNTLDLARLTDAYRSMQVIGDPSTVRTRIEELVERTLADEVMVTTNVYDHAERLRSYERLAATFETATPGK
jgi:alkanesulfonate monooxygenase SsuD/methylene tetrahydromethanopterin reductase-like flavin-dependent oxidoreductase (luciferase family)